MQIAFKARRGDCNSCGEKRSVVMGRNRETLELEPDGCWCLRCGALYSVKVENIEEWESRQWQEKLEATTEDKSS